MKSKKITDVEIQITHFLLVDTYVSFLSGITTSYGVCWCYMEVKQIAAQSNGYIVIAFETNSGTRIERKMTLSIQMAQKLLESSKVKLSYRKGGYPEIVLLPTYELQVKTSLFNGAVAFLGLIVTLIAGVRVQKYINRKSADETGDDFNIERVDP